MFEGFRGPSNSELSDPKFLAVIITPGRFLDDEFVYQQLGSHYLHSYLSSNGFDSDLLVLYQKTSQIVPSMEPALADPFYHNRRDIRRFLIDDDGLRDDVLNIFCCCFASCMDPTDRLSPFKVIT